jgi:GNAT superfamily N-acetyltransferase
MENSWLLTDYLGNSILKRYTLTDVEILSLKEQGINSDLGHEAKSWVECMIPEKDNEYGPDFWRWIVNNYNQNLASPDPIFDTFFLRDKLTQVIVATGSIVSDDRDVGRTYGIDGIWMGGVNVKGEYRGHNIGNVIVELLHLHIQTKADHYNQTIAVNLFTDNPIAKSLYEKHGYVRGHAHIVEHFGREEEFFRIIFRPQTYTYCIS